MIVSSWERLKALQWHRIFHMFYMEPCVFMLLFSHTLSGTIMRNQVIFQTCTTIFHYNVSDCKLLDSKNVSAEINAIETELQPYVANLFLTRTLLESIVPAFFGLFIGSWSDHYGRKPLLVVSMVGFSLTFIATAAICELSSYYDVNPWWYILTAVPHSLLGGNCVFSVAVFCFISDITDPKERPYRMIFMEALFYIGLTSGSLLSSFVYEATNSTITIALSGLISTLSTLFIIFFVPESLKYRIETDAKKIAAEKKADELPTICDLQMGCKVAIGTIELQTVVNDAKSLEANGVGGGGGGANTKEEQGGKKAGLFSFIHIKEMLKTCFKKRDHDARAIIWLVTFSMFLSIFVFDGVIGVMYLFVREKFHWTVRDFTFFETVSHLGPMIGAVVGFLVLRKVFKLSVVSLAMMAFFSEALSNLAKGLASQPWHMYLSVALGAFRSIAGPMCRTIVSNIVPPTDLGKIFSIKNVLQSFAPFVAAPLYTFIYKRTLTTFPGFFNFVSSFLYLLAFLFIMVVLYFKNLHKAHYATVLK